MKTRRLAGLAVSSIAAVLLSLAWVAVGLCAQPADKEAKAQPQYIAYYFYTSRRCGPCKTIEQFAQESIHENFKEELKSGKLQWQALNIDQPENNHFIEDFQLYTKSVILAEYKDGKPERWENLPDVWQLYRDKQKYSEYVARETRSFMEKK